MESFAATKVDDSFLSRQAISRFQQQSVRKTNSTSRNLTVAFVLVVGSGGFLGVSLSLWNVSFVGSILIVVAFVEAIAMLAGFFMFHRRQNSSVEGKT